MRSLLGVSLLWICLIACGGGVSVSTNASNVCSEIAEVACHNVYKCCTEGEIERFLGVDEPRTEPQCKEDVRRRCERDIAKLDAAIEEKRVRFDSDLMNNCLEAIVAPGGTCASVEEKLPWTEACMNTAWVGLVTDGSKCFADNECSSKDSFCAANQTCTAKPTTGQACGAAGCATGNFCQAGTCRTQLAAGQPCTATSQCQPQHFCDTSMAQAVCTAVRNAGEQCTSNAACKSAECLPGTCAGTDLECFTSATCGRRCTNNGLSCFQDSTCGPGTCSITTTTACTSSVQCPAGETCVFPPRCQATECVGTPVCSQPQVVVDYCQGTLQVIGNIADP